MKRNKSGISLIVLVITIIVMIILASAIIITLNNTNLIDRANQGVTAWDLNQVQNIAALAWSEAYLDKHSGETVNFQGRVETALTENGVKLNKYVVTATETGVEVLEANLGGLVRGPQDYGKTVNYSAAGVSNWIVYYEDVANGYVFLTTPTSITSSDETKAVGDLTDDDLELYNIFRLGLNTTFELSDPYEGHQLVAALIANYGAYANTTDYGTNVVGAMGGPTIELLAAAWNSKGYEPTIAVTAQNGGFTVNSEARDIQLRDTIYFLTDGAYWVATPYDKSSILLAGQTARLGVCSGGVYPNRIRPVVCLKSTTPADKGTTTDIALVQ